nr:unnamed protein product [Callosobruchus analis]
MNLPLMS